MKDVIEESDKKTEALESNDSDTNLKNLDAVGATKHGTNATHVNKKEEEEEIDIVP
jgi:hypothetical protein